ncbi:MAG: hypothetical protein IEMM0002_1088 [bacterium]|nr:MAG: hypothetical protein IEMM0002_1088 [bacterium]
MEKKNVFERNPVKTLLFVLFIMLIPITIFLFENLLEVRKGLTFVNQPRYIRLIEHNPLITGYAIPTDKQLSEADGLEKKRFRSRTDEDGFIIPSRIHRHPDFTIVFLGGSTTVCHFVEEQNRFPHLAGRILEKKTGDKINSYNAAVSGSHSMQAIDVLLNKIIPLKPGVVVFMFAINDLNILLLEGSYWNDNPGYSMIIPGIYGEAAFIGWKKYILNNPAAFLKKYITETFVPVNTLGYVKDVLKIGNKIEDVWARRRGQIIQFDKEKILEEFAMSLETFIGICKARKIIPVIMTQENRLKENPDPLVKRLTATLYDDYKIDYKTYQEIYEAMNNVIRRVAKENNVILVDLDKNIPRDKNHIYDLIHMNDQGSIMAANLISEKLLETVKAR